MRRRRRPSGPCERLQAGSKVALLENLRFHAEEEKNDEAFARALASLADVYVNDAFGAAHRAHASVAAIVPPFGHKAAAGLLMEKELRYLGLALGDPDRPFVGILGGAKVSDKIEVIENLLSKVDRLLVGGAMAYTFFKALGLPTGRSLVEDDKLDAARDIITQAKAGNVELTLPVDHVVAEQMSAGISTAVLKVSDTAIGERMGLDIGPETTGLYAERLRDAKTVVWNGPMGVFEIDAFAQGTLGVAEAVAQREWDDNRGWRRLGRGSQQSRRRRAHHPHLDGRWRLAGIPGRPKATWRGGAAGKKIVASSTVQSSKCRTPELRFELCTLNFELSCESV